MDRRTAIASLGALALGLACPALAAAQNNAGAKPKPGASQRRGGGLRRFDAALAKLNLTTDQKAKIKKASDDAKAKTRAIRQGPGTPQEKRPKTREVMKSFRETLNAILTPEQKKQLRAEMAKDRPAGAGKAGAKKTGG
jgi:Spy/CpxP family protein refolding chaperone